MSFNYGDAPEVVYLALFILPMQWLAIIPFPRHDAAQEPSEPGRGRRHHRQTSRKASVNVLRGAEPRGQSPGTAVVSTGTATSRSSVSVAKCWSPSWSEHRWAIARGLLGLVAFYLISARVIEGVLTPGDYGVLIYYYAWFSGALTAIPYVWIRIQHNIPGVRRVFFLMDLPSESLFGAAGHIERDLNRVRTCKASGFVYPDGSRALSGHRSDRQGRRNHCPGGPHRCWQDDARPPSAGVPRLRRRVL